VLENKEIQEPIQKAVEQLYSREELMANVQAIFGVMPEILAGALHGNKAQELTKSEIQKRIKNFLERRVS